MKKEQVTGRIEEAKGAVKEAVGKAEAAAGDLANKVEKAVKK